MSLEINVNDSSVQAQSLAKKLQEEIKEKAEATQEKTNGVGVAVRVDISEKGRETAAQQIGTGQDLADPSAVKELAKKRLKEEIEKIKEKIAEVKKDATLTDEQKEQKLADLSNQLLQVQGEYMKLFERGTAVSGNMEGTNATTGSSMLSGSLKGTIG